MENMYFHFQENPQVWEDWKEAKFHQRQVYFCSCDRGFGSCISARHALPFLYVYWGSHNCMEVKPLSGTFLTSTATLVGSYSIKQKTPLRLSWPGSTTWGIHSLGVNAPTCPVWDCRRVWDTVYWDAWGSPGEKRVPWPTQTSPCPPCSTHTSPPTGQPKEKIQENNFSPRRNLPFRPAAGRLLADIAVSPDWAQPFKWSCGSTGENSHLASFNKGAISAPLQSRWEWA